MHAITTESTADNRHSGDSVGTCTVSLDRGLRIVAANQEMFRRMSGTGPESLCGSSFCDLLDPSIRTRIRDRMTLLLDGQQSRFREPSVPLLLGPGSPVHADLLATAVSRNAGRAEGVVVMIRPGDADATAATTRGGPRKILSGMDARILEGVASGASTVQLASTLYLSRGGVEYHVTALLRKMKVKNRPALISKAYSMGFFEMGSWPPHVVADHVK